MRWVYFDPRYLEIVTLIGTFTPDQAYVRPRQVKPGGDPPLRTTAARKHSIGLQVQPPAASPVEGDHGGDVLSPFS